MPNTDENGLYSELEKAQAIGSMSITEISLVIATVGLVLAIIAVLPMLTGKHIAIAVILSVLVVGLFTHFAYQRATRDEVTLENVATLVRQWSYSFRYGVTPFDDVNCFFAFNALLPNGKSSLIVSRPKAEGYSEYVFLSTTLPVPEDEQGKYSRLSQSEKLQFVRQLRSELTRTPTIQYEINIEPFTSIGIARRVPITKELTHFKFLEAIDEVISAADHTIDIVDLQLDEKLARSMPQPSPIPNTAASPH